MLSWGLHNEFPEAQRSPPIILLQLTFEHKEFSGVGAQWGTYSRTLVYQKVRLLSEPSRNWATVTVLGEL